MKPPIGWRFSKGRRASGWFTLILGVAMLGLLLALVPPAFAAADTTMPVDQIANPDGFGMTEGGPLVSGTSVQGTVLPAGNVDEYTIAGRANQWITVEARGSNGLRPQVEVLYPNGALFTEAHGELVATKTVQLMTTGTYTVQIKSYPYPSQTTGSYTLTVTITDRRP